MTALRVGGIVPPRTWSVMESHGPDGCYIPVSNSPRSIALLQDAWQRLACDEPDTDEDWIRWAEMEDDD